MCREESNSCEADLLKVYWSVCAPLTIYSRVDSNWTNQPMRGEHSAIEAGSKSHIVRDCASFLQSLWNVGYTAEYKYSVKYALSWYMTTQLRRQSVGFLTRGAPKCFLFSEKGVGSESIIWPAWARLTGSLPEMVLTFWGVGWDPDVATQAATRQPASLSDRQGWGTR